MDTIGKYKVIKQLGAGGFGAVYLGETVAIKVFQVCDENPARQTAASSIHAAEVFKQRFLDEAPTLRKLYSNSYIVETYEFDDGTPYYVMPYLTRSLEQEIGKDAFTRDKLEEIPAELHPRRALLTLSLQWLQQILEALKEVYNAGPVALVQSPFPFGFWTLSCRPQWRYLWGGITRGRSNVKNKHG